MRLNIFSLLVAGLPCLQALPIDVYDPVKLAQPLDLKDIRMMLDNEYLAMEVGHGKTRDGMRYVAANTYMRNVTSEMIEWWFGWAKNTDQYLLWHPRDHVQLDWVPPPAESVSKYVGGSHLAREYVGGELQTMKITFRDPGVYFGPTWKEDFTKRNYTTAICSRVALYDWKTKDSFNVGHAIHLLHSEADGIRMRTRFWLGDFDAQLPAIVAAGAVSDRSVTGLVKHATEEMSILANILPQLYKDNNPRGGV